jgi:hypothetical protein
MILFSWILLFTYLVFGVIIAEYILDWADNAK